MREAILRHRKAFLITALGFLVFIGCFSFPMVNFTRSYHLISWINVGVACFAYYDIGLLFRTLYEDKPLLNVAAVTLFFTAIGFICRFLLEFGEVSNTYNFTLWNVLFHTVAAVVITSLTAMFKEQPQ